MSLLFYWSKDHFASDQANGRLPLYRLNQNNPILRDLQPGERVWAFRLSEPAHFILVAEFIVESAGENAKEHPDRVYGDYYFRAAHAGSKYFRHNQPNVEPIIRRLSLDVRTPSLTDFFQGKNAVRSLYPEDDLVLERYASGLEIDYQQSDTPLASSEQSSHGTNYDTQAGISSTREIIREVRNRSSKHVRNLRLMYDGKCQVCGTLPLDGKLGVVAEAHHIKWLSVDGVDELDNMILLCPNHHAAMHGRFRPTFDRIKLIFSFQDQELRIKCDRHLRMSETA